MKSLVIILVLVVAAIGGFWLYKSGYMTTTETSTKTTSEQNREEVLQASVEIKGFSFSPATITVKKGSTLTFTNRDSVSHTATADDGSFDTGLLSQGKSGQVTFNEVGTFSYHCAPHPYMKAKVIVE